MKAIDYRAMADEWVNHIAGQYDITRVQPRDVALIEHLLRAGFTLIAVRDKMKSLRVDFLGKRRLKSKKLSIV